MKALGIYPDARTFRNLLGGGDVWTTRHLLWPTFEYIGNQYVLSIPVNPKPDNQFVPPDETQELKMSEYYRLKEEAEAAKAAN